MKSQFKVLLSQHFKVHHHTLSLLYYIDPVAKCQWIFIRFDLTN